MKSHSPAQNVQLQAINKWQSQPTISVANKENIPLISVVNVVQKRAQEYEKHFWNERKVSKQRQLALMAAQERISQLELAAVKASSDVSQTASTSSQTQGELEKSSAVISKLKRDNNALRQRVQRFASQLACAILEVK
ncbi:hypothetical protein M422DRAFT_250606 [Sphaerobolus stellatus SS14]|uniref:Uncharacterized protein n=1 Tax=Sphaerobolus stellatus (strain SS14) TaxID=990650 RepID=A0A0C9W3M9_SPHS4|nr:hypothetical protein M422DRAFT_250606 [Sphaerobolus stellatus SS14]